MFNNFWNMCPEIYRLDLAHFRFVLGLAWQVALKRTKVKLYLLTYINMLSTAEKCIRDGICQAIHRYVKANNKYMKDND